MSLHILTTVGESNLLYTWCGYVNDVVTVSMMAVLPYRELHSLGNILMVLAFAVYVSIACL